MTDFGARLREARERKGISLRQIAAATKISVAALQGLERNDISKLPGGIFSRAFVRSYATEVGLDPDETVKEFLIQFGGEAPVSPGTPAAPAHVGRSPAAPPAPGEFTEEVDFESKQRMAGVVLRLLLVSVPVVAAILYFGSRSGRPSAQAEGPVPPAATSSAPATPPDPDAPLQADSTAEAAAAIPAVDRPLEAPVAPEASPAAVSAAPILVEIAPTGDCWVQLTADGTTVLSRVVLAGERERREFRESAVLQVGDAAACALAIDGRAARPLGRPRQVREIRLTRDNYSTFLP